MQRDFAWLRRFVAKLSSEYHQNPMLWSMVGCVLVFILWSALFVLDVASYAQGHVIPSGQLKRIQHLEGGIIRNIHVVEGQRVEAGAVIAEMEDVVSTSDVGELNTRAAGLELKVLRLTALLKRAGKLQISPTLEQQYPDFARDAFSAYASARERFTAMMDSHEARIAQRKAEITEAQARIQGLKERSRFIAEQIRISDAMKLQRLTNEYEHLQLKKEQAQIDGDLNSTVANEMRLRTALSEAIAARAAFLSDEEVTWRKELQEANTELASLKERLRKPSDSFNRTQVRAPVAGNIMTLFSRNQGAVVPPGGTLATLVPDGEALLVEAKLPIGEVGFVAMGALARLSLASGASGFSTLSAQVVHISPDAALDEKTGASYYIVRLKPESYAFVRGNEAYALRPGVQVTAAIVTGSRSVLAVLLEPFMGSGVMPLSER